MKQILTCFLEFGTIANKKQHVTSWDFAKKWQSIGHKRQTNNQFEFAMFFDLQLHLEQWISFLLSLSGELCNMLQARCVDKRSYLAH